MSRLSLAWLVCALWAASALADAIGEGRTSSIVVCSIGLVSALLLVLMTRKDHKP